MITVHHLERSRSHRVIWLLEELGLEYEIEHYLRDPETLLAPPELRAIHPLGKSPVVTEGDVTLAESGAILDYFADREGRLAPARGTPERLRYTYWMHYAEGSAMPPLLLKLVFDRVATAPAPFFMRPVLRGVADRVSSTFVDPQIALHFGFIDAELARSRFFAGDDFSAADIQMSYPLLAGVARGGIAAQAPNVLAFLERIRERPAYQRAIERGGPVEI